MGIIKAVSKLAGRKMIDKSTDRKIKNAKRETFNEVGKEQRKHNKQGKYYNSKTAYNNKLAEKVKKLERDADNKKQFLNDL